MSRAACALRGIHFCLVAARCYRWLLVGSKGNFANADPCLPDAQLIGIVVADTEARARAAARQVRVEYEDLPALLSAMEVADAPEGLGKEFTVRGIAL